MAEKQENYLDFQARERAKAVARRYINIFHQLHVIDAPLATLNAEFAALPRDVVMLLPEMMGGVKLHQHIQNLKTGQTPMDKVDPDLLPFGREVFDDVKLYTQYTSYDKASYVPAPPSVADGPGARKAKDGGGEAQIWSMLRSYTNTPESLEAFKKLPAVASLGPKWRDELKSRIATSNQPDWEHLAQAFDNLVQFDDAVEAWGAVSMFVRNPSPEARTKIAPKVDTYKKNLDMFGDAGEALAAKLDEAIGG